MKTSKFIGKRIREYRIIELIGEGGMAAVLKVEHVRLKALRAIKVIRETWSKDKRFLDRFEREARLLVHLSHPNLVQIHEFFEERGHLFLVMSYVNGESLESRLKRVKILTEREMLSIEKTESKSAEDNRPEIT